MAAKLGQEARVAAEVGAAEALMAERAGLAVRLDVGRLGADAEGDGDLADGVTGRLGVQEALDLRAGALGVAGVPGYRARTRACCSRMISAVSSSMGRR
jgi:hypothetical protein